MTISLPPAQGPSAASGEVVDTVAVGQAGLKEGPGGFWRDVFRRLRRNPTAWIGAGIVLAFLVVALLAPVLAPYPETALPGAKYITPTNIPGPGELPEFPLGLDRFGGDVLSKLIWGAQASLLIGVISTAMGLVGGMILGLLAGTFGGWVDTLIMRVVDIILSVPNLLLAVSIAAILGQTPFAVMIAIERLRAVGADSGSGSWADHDVARAPERDRTGHRAGHADARDRRDRCRGAVVPRPRRRSPRDGRVGAHAHVRTGGTRHRAVAGLPARYLHRGHCARLHPVR
jgi:hypothetical protein